MPAKKFGTCVRVYLTDEEIARLAAIAKTTEMSQTDLLSRLCTASIRTISDNGGRFPMPLRFQIEEEDSPPVRALPPKRKAA